MTSQDPSTPILSSVSLFCKRHPAFTPGGMRHHLFYREQNGLSASGAVIKLGRKILIDETVFFRWVKAQGGGK